MRRYAGKSDVISALAGIGAVGIIGLVLLGFLAGMDDRSGYSESELARARADAKVIASYRAESQKLMESGAVHSVDVEFNRVRIDPLVWLQLDLETKQRTVQFFSTYFDAAGSTGRVNVLSSRNDTKLATYSAWTGVKILK